MSDRKKTVTAWAVVDWKKGNVRTRQTEPDASDLKTNELVSRVKFEITVPDVDVPEAAAELEVPEPMVYSAVLEALDDRQRPEFERAADEAVAEHLDELKAADETVLPYKVDSILVETLRSTRGRPDVEDVERYVRTLVDEIRDD